MKRRTIADIEHELKSWKSADYFTAQEDVDYARAEIARLEKELAAAKRRAANRPMTKTQKIKAMMDFYGYSRHETRAMLEDMGE